MGRLGLVHHPVYDVGEQIVGIAKIYLQQGELENVGYCVPLQPVRHANAQIAYSQGQGNLIGEEIRKQNSTRTPMERY